MIYIFTLSLMVTIITLIKFMGLILDNDICLPFDGTIFDVSKAYWFYPSLFFQIWFWTDKLNIVG